MSSSRPKLRLLSVLSVSFWFTVPLWAQHPTATVSGIVTDPSGAVVPGAHVLLTNQATGVTREVTTGIDGRYVFADLTPGVYDVRIEASGFAVYMFKDVHLEIGGILTLDATLRLGQTEAVTVTAEVVAVESVQAGVVGQFSAQMVESIPLNGRNFAQLAFLIPGNREAVNYDSTKTNTLEVSSAGQFGRGGNVTVDGGDNNDEVVGGVLMNFPQGAVREFQIFTNSYTAEAGRSASSVINVVTKSGTNEWHGSAFFFVRNRKIQGLPPTIDRTPCEDGRECRPSFDRQLYGGSIGGPIRQSRAWFFFAVENRHQNGSVPTGFRDFTAKKVVANSAPAPLRDVLLTGRADFKLTDSDTLAVRYSFNRSSEVANGSLQVALGSAANRQDALNRFNSVLTNWTRVLSPTKVNILLFQFNKFFNDIPPFSPNKPTTFPNLGLANELIFPTLEDGPSFRIPQRTHLDRWQVSDNFSWVRGTHTLRFGGQFQNYGSDIRFDLFGSNSVFLAEDFAIQDRNNDGQIDDLDIPIAVVVKSAAAVRPPTTPTDRNTYLGFYAQDDWRSRPGLTLNLGLRWEFDTDVFGQGSLHEACPQPLTTVPTKSCVWLRSVLDLDRSPEFNNFGPRVGFVWDIFKKIFKKRSFVRGGYGIYHDRVVLGVKLLELLVDGRRLALMALRGSTCHNAALNAVDCGAVGAMFDSGTPTLANPFGGAGAPFAVGNIVLANNISHPYVQQWTLGIEQELAPNLKASVDGIHNSGTHFIISRPMRDADNRLVTLVDPLTGLGNAVIQVESSAKTWYDGLLISLQKRPTKHGWWSYGFNANYTLSKAFDFANDDQIAFGLTQQADVAMGGNNLRLEKGYAVTDERHRFVFSGAFEMPWGLGVSPIWVYASNVPGNPFIPALATRLPIAPRNSLARDIKTGADLNRLISIWNGLPACPSTPTSLGPFPCRIGGTLSPVNPSLKFGDNFNSFDMRVTKAFRFGERHKLELIGEVFNLFGVSNIRGRNQRNFFGFDGAITSPTFNQALNTAGNFFGAGGPRAFQFAIQYVF